VTLDAPERSLWVDGDAAVVLASSPGQGTRVTLRIPQA